MRRILLSLGVLLALTPAAQAHRHARFRENSSPAVFTLADARVTAQHFEAWTFRKIGAVPAVGVCRFVRINTAKCPVTLVSPIIVGQIGSSTIQWTDLVTVGGIDCRPLPVGQNMWCYHGLTAQSMQDGMPVS